MDKDSNLLAGSLELFLQFLASNMNATANGQVTVRKWRRVSVELPALVVLPDRRGHPGTILDLSRGGARLRMKGAPEVGCEVTLRLYGFTTGPMSLPATVVHTAGSESGVRFRDSADLPRLCSLLAGMKS